MKKYTEEQKGITLIALVITIIVLLILAGVALATLTGNTSIIENANNAVERYNESANADQNVIDQVENLFAKYMGTGTNVGNNDVADDDDDDDSLVATPSVDANGFATAQFTVVANATNNVQIVIPAGFAPAILNGSDSTTSLPGQDGSVKSVMPANQWNSITAEQINKGVVIVNSAGEEYVWVPIPNLANNFKRTAWDYEYNEGENIRNVDQTLGTASDNGYIGLEPVAWEDETSTEYVNMVASVDTNKGFYISRYEASKGANDVAQSKRGQATYVGSLDVAIATIVSAAKTASLANSTPNTHLMYGIEWDSVCSWLLGNATISSSTSGQTKTMELADLTNSLSWGNYSTSTGNAATSSGSLRTTGYSEYWKANNIYDLAGNISEFTQEVLADEPVDRAGSYGSGNSESSNGYYNYYQVVCRAMESRQYFSANETPGFRYSFYL